MPPLDTDEPDARQIAEALWLAAILPVTPTAEPAPGRPPGTSEGTPPGPPPPDAIPPATPSGSNFDSARASEPAGDRRAYLGGGDAAVPSFQSPSGRAVSEIRTLSRALRPLRRRTPDPSHQTLDLDATLEAFAHQRVFDARAALVPKLVPQSRRSWDLVLLTDRQKAGAPPTHALLQEISRELAEMLRWLGAFRLLQTTWLEMTDQRIVTGALDRQISPRGDRLFVALTDLRTPAWANGHAFRWLGRLARRAPVTLWHILPERQWDRTACGTPRWLARNGRPGGANAGWECLPRPGVHVPRDTDPTPPGFVDVPLPVVALEPEPLARWARFVGGDRRATLPAVRARLPRDDRPVTTVPTALLTDDDSLSVPERLIQFFDLASPAAHRLAALSAGVPLTLPILRTVLRTRAGAGIPSSAIAELLMSPLIQPFGRDRFVWRAGVAERLLERVPVPTTLEIRAQIGAFLGNPPESSVRFDATLDPIATDDAQLFASLSAATLEKLGLGGRPAPVSSEPESVTVQLGGAPGTPPSTLPIAAWRIAGAIWIALRAWLQQFGGELLAVAAADRSARILWQEREQTLVLRSVDGTGFVPFADLNQLYGRAFTLEPDPLRLVLSDPAPAAQPVVAARTRRRALVIGVDRVGTAVQLQGAAADAAGFASWASSIGCEVTLLTDIDERPVRAQAVADALHALWESADCAQLFVYFSGSAVSMDRELWLLSAALENPQESIPLDTFIAALRSSGIPHVTIFTDACRTHPTGQLVLEGSLPLPTTRSPSFGVIDVFHSAGSGDVAWEVPDRTGNKPGGLFTRALLRALRGEVPEAIETHTENGATRSVVTAPSLRAYLVEEVPRLSAEQNLSPQQIPDIRIESNWPHFLAEVTTAPSSNATTESSEPARVHILHSSADWEWAHLLVGELARYGGMPSITWDESLVEQDTAVRRFASTLLPRRVVVLLLTPSLMNSPLLASEKLLDLLAIALSSGVSVWQIPVGTDAPGSTPLGTRPSPGRLMSQEHDANLASIVEAIIRATEPARRTFDAFLTYRMVQTPSVEETGPMFGFDWYKRFLKARLQRAGVRWFIYPESNLLGLRWELTHAEVVRASEYQLLLVHENLQLDGNSREQIDLRIAAGERNRIIPLLIGDRATAPEELADLPAIRFPSRIVTQENQARFGEAFRTLLQRLDLSAPDPQAADEQFKRGESLLQNGHIDEAIDAFRQAQAIFARLGNTHGQAESLLRVGYAFTYRQSWQEAVGAYQEGLLLSNEVNDQGGQAIATSSLGFVLSNLGRLDEALDFLEKSIELQRVLGNHQREALDLSRIGDTLSRLRRWEEALQPYQQSLKLAEESGDPATVAPALDSLATALVRSGQNDEGVERFRQCLKLYQSIGNRKGEAWCLLSIGMALPKHSRDREALDYFQQSFRISEESGDQIGQAKALGNMSQIYAYQEQWEQAVDAAERSLLLFRMLGNRQDEAVSHTFIGNILRARGDLAAASASYRSSLALLDQPTDLGTVGRVQIELANVLSELADIEGARSAAQAALDAYTQIGDTDGEVQAQALLGQLTPAA